IHDKEFYKSNLVKCLLIAMNIPLQSLSENIEPLNTAENILVFCQSGIRSRKAVAVLRSKFLQKNIYSVAGGISKLNSTINA
ncbi:MAG TPA: rhodanese-like domain-containing protein, partial [Bacteroidia bacterium]|nr:rhodanese-like domain-containing protein [Bacteroidia bacterium]